MLRDVRDYLIDESDVNADSVFKWHVRGRGEQSGGASYPLGCVIAKDLGEATQKAHQEWPLDNAFLDWCEVYYATPD